MQTKATAATLAPSKNGILFVSGFATSLRIERGQLLVRSGAGRHIAEARIPKVGRPRLRRLVVYGKGGFTTWEALAWLHGIGAAFANISRDGSIVATSAHMGTDVPAMRRAQARALDSRAGLETARHLIKTKLEGQRRVLGGLASSADGQASIEAALRALGTARTIDEVRLAESAGARGYWPAWSEVTVTFARADAPKVPEHWRTFGSRVSGPHRKAQNALNPANAILNYLYALAEAETRLACLTMGLEPGLGIVHADLRGRDSLAFDLMEAIRPEVDAYVLELLAWHTFTRREFAELPNGTCRIRPTLARSLAETMSAWAAAVAPVTELVARTLAGRVVPTKLTQANRLNALQGASGRTRRAASVRPASIPRTCRSCGVVIARTNRLFCEECLVERRREHIGEYLQAGQRALARLRTEGRDPTSSGAARWKAGRTNAERRQGQIAWDRAHPERPEPEIFRRDILPGLQGLSLSRIMSATGLSLSHSWRIRRGETVPHPRHWAALGKLAGAEAPRSARAVADALDPFAAPSQIDPRELVRAKASTALAIPLEIVPVRGPTYLLASPTGWTRKKTGRKR